MNLKCILTDFEAILFLPRCDLEASEPVNQRLNTNSELNQSKPTNQRIAWRRFAVEEDEAALLF